MIRWSRIAQNLPGRTDNEIKNYWRTRIEKKMNIRPQSCSSSMDAASKVIIERSTASNSITGSSQRPSDLDIAEPPTTSIQRKTTEEIEVQTNATPYLQDDISSQVIPITEGNYVNKLKGEVEGQDNQLFKNNLLYNFSVGSLPILLYSSEFGIDDLSQDGRMAPSCSYMVDYPEAFSDSETYLNRYSDVLWNMDQEDDRFIGSQRSGSRDNRDHVAGEQ